ncbi:MAG: FAD-dependent oxidoreductase [Thermodesulfobacteriota bacterium]|nr:FAD-dependent oxidoreductase [Thermodesulfobacteriota bacterium]
MITFKLNGQEVQGEEGEYILQVAEKYGVEIPTLCHHKALEPAGMCRICTVELYDGRRTRFVTACNYPIWEGMEVKTDTEAVHQGRRLIVEMLLARCPDVPVIRDLAKGYGIEEPRFKKEDDDCILCGLCVRVCERMGYNAISLTGRGVDMKVDTPFHIQTDACAACGACASVCPTGHISLDKLENITKHVVKPIPSEYDMGLKGRKPIYVPYAQAIPNTPAIDRSKCVHFKTGGCKICTAFCGVNAIDHSQEDETIELNVGSIVLAPGFEPFDPSTLANYNYTNNPNILTSMEFERILSASGPTMGHLVRPSDHKEPEKIAWLQCIGSRDTHIGSRGYCSSVCCTYAIKEAMLAKEHSKNSLDAAIFYMDIRTYGKDFERYYNRGRDEAGIRFIKSRITNIVPDDDTGKQLIRYVDETGRRVEEEFDIVVLSVGLCITEDTADLAHRLNVGLDQYNFVTTTSFEPVKTSAPGIFVCGAFEAPKDIPSSVVESSAAAGVAGSSLIESRWTLTKTKEIPEETDIRGEATRIGVFVCRCGTNIAGVVDVPTVVDFALSLPGVVYAEENMYSCSQDTQEKMAEVIKEKGLNRIVVAACTPKTHEPLFQETLTNAGINKYLFEMVNIRNQDSWVHAADPEAATTKAKDLVRMAVAKAGLLEALVEPTLEVDQAALVIGGGISGMTAARTLSNQGYQTYLIENEKSLGGQARRLYETWRREDVQQDLTSMIEDVQSNEKVEVYLGAKIKKVDGFIGNFKTTIEVDGKEHELRHGIAIIASGASELKPEEHLYGKDPRVLTGQELDQKLIENDSSIRQSKSAVFIQCVGSRIDERPYCSKVCCTHSIRNALKLKELNRKMDVFILYRDMRSYGLREDLYREARSKGIMFIRYDFDKDFDVNLNEGDLQVIFTDSAIRRQMEIRPDLLVLASAIVPPKENPLAQLFKVALNDDGFFMEAHAKLRPVDCATDGVFICGLAHAPKPIDESIAQAQAAATRGITLLAKKTVQMSGTVAEVNPMFCSGCGVCLAICPFSAPGFVEEGPFAGKAEVNPVLCKGCGLCVASCRSGALNLKGFGEGQIMAMINGI